MATNPVLAALAQSRLRAAPMFARWCEFNGVTFCPAPPATVAKFVSDCEPLGIARLWAAVQDISKMHVMLGLADPTLGGAVAAAISGAAGLTAPRAWPETFKQRFKSLPYDVQLFIVEHETGREKALRRAQNEAAALRRNLAEVQKPQSATTSGNEVNEIKGSKAAGKSPA